MSSSFSLLVVRFISALPSLDVSCSTIYLSLPILKAASPCSHISAQFELNYCNAENVPLRLYAEKKPSTLYEEKKPSRLPS
ncbi:hypothetical protein MRB53_030723 [Persea americana]|uniref:Uncharacterized protein n=1 Tax=Persea americana TaxID=3435 RepID=A0ACC2KM29_PERAE|nr:hypothetical protein MRB53_030723 [Persea americana]